VTLLEREVCDRISNEEWFSSEEWLKQEFGYVLVGSTKPEHKFIGKVHSLLQTILYNAIFHLKTVHFHVHLKKVQSFSQKSVYNAGTDYKLC